MFDATASPDEQTMDHPSTFTNQDRRTLITVEVELGQLQNDFKRLRETLEEASPPSKSDFVKLEERMRSLENFKWWIMGIAALSGSIAHLLLSAATGKP